MAAHGSWEPGTLPTQVRATHRDSDVLAFKAYLFGATFDPDLMVLAGFPGGYAGMVHRDPSSLGISACLRRGGPGAGARGASGGDGGRERLRLPRRDDAGGRREAISGAEYERAPAAAGPLRPGIRPGYADGVFRVGNAAGEAHPAIADGLSMAIQSGALLASHLAEASLDRASLDRVGAAYSAAWRAQFGGRLRAADLYARACMSPVAHAVLAPLLTSFPALLTFGAVLSGKTKPLHLSLQPR